MSVPDIPVRILAWTAGIVDGEGCIRIKKYISKNRARSTYYVLEFGVKMVHKPTIDFLSETFGGIVLRQKPGKLNVRVMWKWQMGSEDAMRLLAQIVPYMRVKREQAELALKFQVIGGRGPRTPVHPALLAEREGFFQEMQRLKTEEWK